MAILIASYIASHFIRSYTQHPRKHRTELDEQCIVYSAGIEREKSRLPASHILLIASAVAVLLVSLAPTAKEQLLYFVHSSSFMEAYMGDGILIGDSETNLPFSTVHWHISQVPAYGHSRHTVSIFVVPERVARRHIYQFKSNYTSDECYKANSTENSVGMRSSIYLLPERYLKHSKYRDSKAYFEYELLLADCRYERNMPPLISYQFQSRDYFSDYLDGEHGAEKRAVGCNCLLRDEQIDESCPNRNRKCVEKLKRDFGCTKKCLEVNNGKFSSKTSSYNFFAIKAPKGSLVKYRINVEMYFYNHTMLGKYYMCTIRGTDTCPLKTPGYTEHFPFKQRERHLIIAYVHPTSVPGFFTTRLLVEAKVKVDYLTSFAFLCACVVFFIIKHCLKGTFGCFKSVHSET